MIIECCINPVKYYYTKIKHSKKSFSKWKDSNVCWRLVAFFMVIDVDIDRFIVSESASYKMSYNKYCYANELSFAFEIDQVYSTLFVVVASNKSYNALFMYSNIYKQYNFSPFSNKRRNYPIQCRYTLARILYVYVYKHIREVPFYRQLQWKYIYKS